MRRNRKGFTLAELLIVVAIIAVLAAIAIPVYHAHLNKVALAVDTANERIMQSYFSVVHNEGTLIAEGFQIRFDLYSTEYTFCLMEDGTLHIVTTPAKPGTIPDGIPIRFGDYPEEGACRAQGTGNGHNKGDYLVFNVMKVDDKMVPIMNWVKGFKK